MDLWNSFLFVMADNRWHHSCQWCGFSMSFYIDVITEDFTIHRTWCGYYWASEHCWWKWHGCMCVWPVAWQSGRDKEKETDSCCSLEPGTVRRAAEQVSPFTKANMTSPVHQQSMSSRGFELIQSQRQRKSKEQKQKFGELCYWVTQE